MVKSIHVSNDESLLFTGGSDGTIKLWDIGQGSVVATLGAQKQHSRQNHSNPRFHSDTVSCIIPGMNQNDDNIISGSKDGSICMHDILSYRSNKIFNGKEAITTMTLDQRNEMLWYGTQSSHLNCISIS